MIMMSLEQLIMDEMKVAMKSQDEKSLRSLRAIKAEIIKAKTEPGSGGQLSEEGGIKLLQKMLKQRKESLAIYQQQNRTDLSQKEQEEITIIEKFLPQPLTKEELVVVIKSIIQQVGAKSIVDLGKVMGLASKQLSGKADGKELADLVKKELTELAK